MLNRLKKLWHAEAVLCIAALCALLTMFIVPPDFAYIGYIDCHVLILLFALMATVAGLKECGLFGRLTVKLLAKANNGKSLGLILIWLPYFCAMLVTNDVALIVFVPFTIALLEQIRCRRQIVPTLVVQTAAANLGSMATPVGNPQNLFLYSAYQLSPPEFFGVTLPLSLLSLLLLSIAALRLLPSQLPNFTLNPLKEHHAGKIAAYGVLFVLSLLAVFRLLPDSALLLIVPAAIVILDRQLLRGLDYALLATFVCFFIVSGNLARIEQVDSILQTLLGANTLLTAAACSQIISNVPAAVLLSSFTNNWQELLPGVDIGGLGTPIASLASLITLKLYMKSDHAEVGRFMIWFFAVSIVLLLILLTAASLI